MATRKVYASYQEIIDLNTIGDTISVIGIHTPTGDTPHKMFPGFFQQYRKWKYLGCSVVGRNAAQLPVDPLGVGYEAGEGNENVMDPRDAFDPIMFHGCHGEDMGQILNKLYFGAEIDNLTDSLTGFIQDQDNESDAGRADVTEGLYYKALTDRTWKKFGIQSGFQLRRLHPLVYSMATNHQISPSFKAGGIQMVNGVPTVVGGIPEEASSSAVLGGDFQIFTPRLQSLGWMDTRVPFIGSSDDVPTIGEDYSKWIAFLNSTKNYATMPKLFMGVLLLPMSRRVQQFLRIVITHRFVFAGFRGASLNDNILGSPSMFHMDTNEFGPTDSEDDALFPETPRPDPDPEPEPDPDPPVEIDYKVEAAKTTCAGYTSGNALKLDYQMPDNAYGTLYNATDNESTLYIGGYFNDETNYIVYTPYLWLDGDRCWLCCHIIKGGVAADVIHPGGDDDWDWKTGSPHISGVSDNAISNAFIVAQNPVIADVLQISDIFAIFENGYITAEVRT